MTNNNHILTILAWLAIGQLCTGCSAEDIAGEAPSEMGVLCLQMSSDEDFVQVETREVQTLTDDFTGYTFKLNDKPISFTDDGKAIIPAGTYTLSATNASAVNGGYSGPLYEGATEFTLYAGEQKNVALNLGSPKNAKVTIELSEGFNGLYTFVNLTLTDDTGSNTITPTEQVAYFPATNTNTTLRYTLVANAKQDSHVQDITGAKGTVNIAPGTHTTLTLVVNPIDPNLVTIDTGTPYNGEFQ